MPNLYACIIAEDVESHHLMAIATEFAYRSELIAGGILFDISGLEKLVGRPPKIAAAILEAMEAHGIAGSVAVSPQIDTAILLAFERKGLILTPERIADVGRSRQEIGRLPLTALPIENDTLSIFQALGINRIQELRDIPVSELISRYGKNFVKVLDIANETSRRTLTPNIKETSLTWEKTLDFSVSDFEQMIFLLNHGLSELFKDIVHLGYSTESINITLGLENKASRVYEIKTSRPTLDRSFWLKLINLRISAEPPEKGIVSITVVLNFTRPRPGQNGLFAVTRPEPENLLLTVNKLKKLLGEKNVGVPVLLDERLPEAFTLEGNMLPEGIDANAKNNNQIEIEKPVIGFYYYIPPLSAEVLVRNKRLIYLRTSRFRGRVENYSGVWKQTSKWWATPYKTHEWDVELEQQQGVYRLCKRYQDWFVVGEYD